MIDILLQCSTASITASCGIVALMYGFSREQRWEELYVVVTQCLRKSMVSSVQGGAISGTVLEVIEDPRTLF